MRFLFFVVAVSSLFSAGARAQTAKSAAILAGAETRIASKTLQATLFADGQLILGDERGNHSTKIGVAGARSASLRFVHVEKQDFIHLRFGRTQAALLLQDKDGGFSVEEIARENTGAEGDGERSIEWNFDSNGLMRYQTSPSLDRCDGENKLLPERFDFSARQFRRVALPVPLGGTRLRPSASVPPDRPPLFHMVAASTAAGDEGRADRIAAPRELEDSDLDTTWQSGPLVGQWVTARTPAKRPLRLLRIVPGPTPPRELIILSGNGDRYRVTFFPSEKPLLFSLPEKAAACVSFVVAETAAEPAQTSLAEIAIFSDADYIPLANLAIELATGDNSWAKAPLIAGGKPAAQAIIALWPRSNDEQKLRLGDALSSISAPDITSELASALATAPEKARPALLQALERRGDAAIAAALQVAADETLLVENRAAAIDLSGKLLEHSKHQDANIDGLSGSAGRGPVELRAATLRALKQISHGAQYRQQLELAITKLSAHSLTTDARRALADLCLAIAAYSGPQLLEAAWARARDDGDFDLRFALLRALGDSKHNFEPVFSEVIAHDPDEVLRWVATEAAHDETTLLNAARDRDPRTRRAAVQKLATLNSDGSERELRQALKSDRWPMVRSEAAAALGHRCLNASTGAKAHIATALAEVFRYGRGSESVQLASIESYSHCSQNSEPIEQALLLESAPLSLRELATALLARRSTGSPALLSTARRLLAAPTQDESWWRLVASCVRALGHTQNRSDAVLEVLSSALDCPVSAVIRVAALDAVAELCPDGASAAFKRGSAAIGARRCPK